MIEQSERQELDDALAGDRDALRRFVTRMTPVIHARVARVLIAHGRSAGRDIRQEVEDLTQDVFVALFTNNAQILRSWDPGRGLSQANFVGLVARRRAISIVRTEKRNPWTEEATSAETLDRGLATTPDIEAALASKDLLRKAYDRMSGKLTDQGKAIYQLMFLEERSNREISEAEDLSEAAVYQWRSRLNRAVRKELAELLSNSEASARTSTQRRRPS